ncbi:MAG: type II toxin-antitoxin system Phd/YefM family antitoxin [Candidatus Aminicenantes bacterium]|nr:MAG: type II toxin-antitoxin system Phd/YefM family antitoxin [Candidatus Aminicenantes bacterium]
MKLSASKLRQNLYQVLDEVLEKGTPVEIERKGKILKIVPGKSDSKLMNLEPHDTIIGDPESIVNIDWSKEWTEVKNL